MSRTTANRLFKYNALLCTALMLVVPILTTSCGPTTTNLQGETLIALTADHSLAQALKGSIFEGATALAVSPTSGEFRLIHPHKVLTLRGKYASDGDVAAVSEFTLGREANLTTLTIDAYKRITTVSANGLTWHRPANWTSQADLASPTDTASLLEANSELIDAANEFGQFGPTTGTTPGSTAPSGGPGSTIPKQTAAAQAAVFPLVLAPLTALWIGLIAAPIVVPLGLLVAPLAFVVGATIVVIGTVSGILPKLGLTLFGIAMLASS